MSTRCLFVGAAAIALSACAAHPVVPPLGPPTLPDPAAFLVQLRCPDGGLQVSEPACPGALPQTSQDPLIQSRHDWPAPTGYMAQDAVQSPQGPETLWSFQPFGAFTPTNGDGGEVYVVEAGTVRISLTQDGGKPYLQGFYGAACGGTGWLVFRSDAAQGGWTNATAALKSQSVPSGCKATSAAFTRYRLEQVEAPWIILGTPQTITLPTIISEHYGGASIASSSSMERSFFAQGVGRIIWEAWTTAPTPSTDQAARCPGTQWSTPPAPGWSLADCRYATNLVTGPGSPPIQWPGPIAGALP